MILTNCRLIPDLCEGFQKEFADIRIEKDSIAEILPAGGSYAGEKVLDCSGKTVLPGLFNLHAHLFFNGDEFDRIVLRNEYEMTVQSIHYMQVLLAYGYTSIRDVGTQFNMAIKMRDLVNAGRLTGPNITACGLILTPNHVQPPLGCYSDDYGSPVNDPYAVRAAVRRQMAEGADFIKILGCSAKPGRRGDAPLFYEDEMKELVRSVKNEGTYLAVHTNGPESLDSAIDWEAYTIEHAHFMEAEHIDRIRKHGCRSNIIPTFQITWGWGEEVCAAHCTGMHHAYDAGLMLGWGTDAPEDMFLGNPAGEFIARNKIAGMAPLDLLKQVTINSAVINGVGEERGSIKIGKKADLAVVNGNPDQDLTVFGEPCAFVIKDGILVAEQGRVKAF